MTLDEKRDYKIGVAQIELDLCLLSFNSECQICKRDCPRDAVAFSWDDETYTMTPQIDLEQCNGCGACVIHCPGTNSWELEADPMVALRKAIRIG